MPCVLVGYCLVACTREHKHMVLLQQRFSDMRFLYLINIFTGVIMNNKIW